jgi:AcrR family transcriptional regulator
MTKQDIICSAFRVWGQDLYQSTSLTALARDLQVSKPALYRHFENKEAILQAMYTCFFDQYAAGIKPYYDQALATDNITEQYTIMVRANVDFYARQLDLFIFSLMQVYGNREPRNMGQQLQERGIDMYALLPPRDDIHQYPALFQLVIASLTCLLALFHKQWYRAAPSEAAINTFKAFVEEKMIVGLGLDAALVDSLDYEKLEAVIAGQALETAQDKGLLQAVAAVVAEAGPWEASMEAIARKSGLSKSSLYSHFKNKQDMLMQMFRTEFDHIIRAVKVAITLSDKPAEQLYMAVLALVDYLHSHQEILSAVDRIRMRGVESEPPIPVSLLTIFSGIHFAGGIVLSEELNRWVLFIVINTLMHRPKTMSFAEISNKSIRKLFRFVCLGLSGFLGEEAPVSEALR